MKGMKDIKCSVNLWVFQVLLAGIVDQPQYRVFLILMSLCSFSRVSVLRLGVNLTKRFAELYKDLSSYSEVFAPAIEAIKLYVSFASSITVLYMLHNTDYLITVIGRYASSWNFSHLIFLNLSFLLGLYMLPR